MATTQPVFTRSFPQAQGIEGMMSDFSMQVMDAVLQQQAGSGRTGHLVEFGVYKGKSAAVIAHQVHAGEKFVLVDVERYVTEETLAALPGSPQFVLGRSDAFTSSYPGFDSLRRAVRFLHVDSSHTYRTTLAEMALADELLAPHGVVCLDDYTNLNFSQILPAVFKYLYTTDTDLTPFLVTNEKAYLCRRPAFAEYADFVLKDLVDEVQARGSGPVTLARTDVDQEYSAFHLRGSLRPDEGRHYGEQIYGGFYREGAPVNMAGGAAMGLLRRMLRR